MIVRRAGLGDAPFLRDMLRHAYYWRWGDPEGIPVARYVEGWGRRGDAAVVAIEDAAPVGAAWYRLFRESARGFGFVDEATPELTIAVVPSRRGRGYGAQLLEALLGRARADGYPRVSLSVERDNPARELYERQGFRAVREEGATVVMLLELGSSETGGNDGM